MIDYNLYTTIYVE